jgi:tellurite resistance protein TerC
MNVSIGIWIGFNAFVLGMLALDLGVFHREAKTVSIKSAAIWSGIWVALAMAFNLWIWFTWGKGPALEFLTGYLIEKSLSVDNIFVFVILFSYFAVPPKYQHRILFWGILGALAMRGLFIAAGSYVLEQFYWVLYLFGAILIVTGIKMVRRQASYSPEHNPVLKMVRRVIPVATEYRGAKFWVREAGRWVATPLFLVLVMVELTDLVFAIDSIPAIFAVTREPFLVFTCNVFAILGLRSMYFLLAGVVHRFVYLKYGLAAVLIFVGVKMVIVDFYKIPTSASLMVVLMTIGLSIALSLLHTRRGTGSADSVKEAPVNPSG